MAEFQTNFKPARGTALLKRKATRKANVAAEQKQMQAALTRDKRKCRVPQCDYREMPVDPCHLKDSHRGMGGNPRGDRTTRNKVIALCRIHHGMYDAGELRITPQSDKDLFDGPCVFAS